MPVQDWACVCVQKAVCEVDSWVHIAKVSFGLIFQNLIYFLIKRYIIHFNASQVNLTSDWALNQSWVLKFSIIGEQEPES